MTQAAATVKKLFFELGRYSYTPARNWRCFSCFFEKTIAELNSESTLRLFALISGGYETGA